MLVLYIGECIVPIINVYNDIKYTTCRHQIVTSILKLKIFNTPVSEGGRRQ